MLFPDGTVKAVQAYRVGTAADGNHFVLLLDLLFNFLFSSSLMAENRILTKRTTRVCLLGDSSDLSSVTK